MNRPCPHPRHLLALVEVAQHAVEGPLAGSQRLRDLGGGRRRQPSALERRHHALGEVGLLDAHRRAAPGQVHQIGADDQDLPLGEPLEIDLRQWRRRRRQQSAHGFRPGHARSQPIAPEELVEDDGRAARHPLEDGGGDPTIVAAGGALRQAQRSAARRLLEHFHHRRVRAAQTAREVDHGRSRFAGRGDPVEDRAGVGSREGRERGLQPRPAQARPLGIEHLAAAERRRRRRAADDEPIVARGGDRRHQSDLDHRLAPGSERRRRERPQSADHFAREQVEADVAPAADDLRRFLEQVHAREQAGRGRVGAGRRELRAARHRLELEPGELERGALAGLGMAAIVAVHLDAAHPRLAAVGQQLEAILRRDAPARQGAGDQHAETAQVKGAIDRQPRRP